MLTVLSPAKTLDFDSASAITTRTEPEWLVESEKLVQELRKKSPKQLAKLMSISEKLAQLNHDRFQRWVLPINPIDSKQAVLAFKGEVYLGLQAERWTEKQMRYAQDHLRILSGLYGILRPLDSMLPYRLEMGTALKTRRGKDLYAFWGERITQSINGQLAASGDQYLLNLASDEYFRSVHVNQISVPVIAPTFKDLSHGKYRVLSFFAKKARGVMAAWVINKQIKTPERLARFAEDGYRFDEASSTINKPVFLRD